MDWDELQHHLEPEYIGTAPKAVKFGVVMTLFVVVIAAGLYFDTKSQLENLEKIEKKEKVLILDLRDKADKAAKLDLYKEQLAEMKVSFGALLRQLPERTDVESLLVDVSQTGLASGLEIKRFKPSPEEKKEFYAEVPIALQMIGSFHQLATFISGIAALPRIVTIHNLVLEPQKSTQGSGNRIEKLQMSAVAKTYRYLKEDEQ